MFTSERITRAAMAHQIELDAADRALDIALAVERQITCPQSGRVLDSRTAVGIWENGPNESRAFVGVLDPRAADELRRKLDRNSTLSAYVFDTAADVWAVLK